MTEMDMDGWKREKIGDYRALSAIVAQEKSALECDGEINKAKFERDRLDGEIRRLSAKYVNVVNDAINEQQMIKMELLDHWDIDGKSFKCDMGSATLRTTKTLEISDQSALLILLFKLERLESAIRTLDTSYLKKLKDADMIPDALAVYKHSTNVAISGEKE